MSPAYPFFITRPAASTSLFSFLDLLPRPHSSRLAAYRPSRLFQHHIRHPTPHQRLSGLHSTKTIIPFKSEALLRSQVR
eukprot:scaffold1327_cov65-Cyclotella_meneghiniana.AAC.16